VRLLEVRLAGYKPEGSGHGESPIRVIHRLEHPGYGLVAQFGRDRSKTGMYQVEWRIPPAPADGLDFRDMIAGDVVQDLQTRKDNVPFEGYSPYTTWKLTLRPPTEKNVHYSGVRVAFAYAKAEGTPVTEGDFLEWYRNRFAAAADAKAAKGSALFSSLPVPWIQTQLVDHKGSAVTLDGITLAEAIARQPGAELVEGAPLLAATGCDARAPVRVAKAPPQLRVVTMCRDQAAIAADLVRAYEQDERPRQRQSLPYAIHKRAVLQAQQQMAALRASNVCHWSHGKAATPLESISLGRGPQPEAALRAAMGEK
jgi:hypothetical protein